MDMDEYFKSAEKLFKKKRSDSQVEFKMASEERPAYGLVVDNPQLEYILDRRFLAYGRFYLVYGKKGSSKTSFGYDLIKTMQKAGGFTVMIETEHAMDINYAAMQGVNLSKLRLHHSETLEEGLELAESYIRAMPKVDPEGTTPGLILLDSIAGSTTDYEADASHTITDATPGAHARVLSRFYREMEHPLANEKCIMVVTNQMKEKIGAFGFSEEAHSSMLGGSAPLFSSTYQWKFAKMSEITKKDAYGAERKFGSTHKIDCTRNKLGREGKGQSVEADLYIAGGADWYSPLVRHLGKDYQTLLTRGGGKAQWMIPNTTGIGIDGKPYTIDHKEEIREREMALLLFRSPQMREVVREAFGVPPLPSEKEIKESEAERLSKRKKSNKKKSLDGEDNEAVTFTNV